MRTGFRESLTVLLALVLAAYVVSPQHLLADVFFVTEVSPTSGPTTGGTTITISGHEFTGATAVYFGVTPATSFTENSDLSITATSPAEAAGIVDVTVSVDASTTGIVEADEFASIAAPRPPKR